jgi:uncharacterized metal-binding protein
MAELECATCAYHVCRDGIDCFKTAERVQELYRKADPSIMKLMVTAAKIEAEGYLRWPRAEEIIHFAREAGFSHLGVAFCIGLHQEANAYVQLLEKTFKVSSVCCKVCGVQKDEFDLKRLHPEREAESMCSPLGQAELLNEAGTDFNIVMGLCVGHDALFSKHSQAPVTTLIAKDRVLAHNPAGALYSRYWKKKLGDQE